MIAIKRNLVKFIITVMCMTSLGWNHVYAVEGAIITSEAANKISQLMNIDAPAVDSVEKGDIKVVGWALNASGVKEVKVYVDNTYIGNATIGNSRLDVGQAFPGYVNGDKSGYEYTINTANIAGGVKNIKVQAIGNDGSVQERNVSVNVSKLAPMMNVDAPAVNSVEKGNIKVVGWALNASGVKEVKVYVDNTYIGNATIGNSRLDVGQAFPGYVNGDKSGYEYTINTANIAGGVKNIKVQAIGNDGSVQERNVSVNVSKLAPMMNVDAPAVNSVEKGNIKVVGWALNASGVKEVKVYVDNTYIGNATIGNSRLDVGQAFPGYVNGDKSGYEYTINTANIAGGVKNIKVQAIGNDGSVQERNVSVNVSKLVPMMNVDSPAVNSVEKGNIKVVGWALNASGVKEVKVYVDNTYIGNATIGSSRLDVGQAFPGYVNGDKSGYEYTINTTTIASGVKNIKVQAIGNDGSVQERNVSVNVSKLAPIMNVDAPAVNSVEKGNIKVVGWALNASGVKEVKVYVDNTYIGNATIGSSRLDVGQAFPGYVNGDKSGYEYTINTTTIASGVKNIKVQAIGNDGSVQERNISINITKPKPITNIDVPIINSTVNEELQVKGWALNASGIKEIKLYVDNSYIGSASIGISRADVGMVYPEYINASISGYEYIIDTSAMIQGTKVVKIQAIGYDGSQDEVITKINVMHSTTTYISYPNTFNSYIDIQMEKKPLIQDKYTLLWRYATRDEVAYYMNPTSFVNDPIGKYMFLKLNYSDGIQPYQLNNILKGKGVLEGKGEAFIEAGKRANVNPIYLVAHALLETGNGTSNLARGAIKIDKIHVEFGNENSEVKNVEAKAIYNMYGIGALDKGADLWGSEKAYSEGWFTVEDAIIGGAKWIGNGYINSSTYNQNTLYKMRWDFSNSTMWHQYATDVAWAYKQTARIKAIIDAMDDPVIHFEIPIFYK
ncbi:Ig-like domain-containing protein [Clostridium intestinale]|uniref:Glucosaminidase domain-containing protein n=1 Tax=Clostridium intestinale TaxID=36845 RepID=A0A7D6VZ48_9CLOT|nr:Ig-like domain-containing protein [Clostridium intestinale]QLY79091.1 glucosaminidase domain-containing protein [Clostridium intestinale]